MQPHTLLKSEAIKNTLKIVYFNDDATVGPDVWLTHFWPRLCIFIRLLMQFLLRFTALFSTTSTLLLFNTAFAAYHADATTFEGFMLDHHFLLDNQDILSPPSYLLEDTQAIETPNFKVIPTPCSGNRVDPSLPWLDRTHLTLSQRVCNAALRFDRFFGDVRYDNDFARSFIRVRNNMVIEQDKDTELRFRPRVRARFHLPNAKERLNLIISDDSDDQDSLSTATETIAFDEEEPNRYTTTLRWIAEHTDDLEVDFDIGARFNDQLQLFIRNRYRKFYPIDEQRAWRFTGTFFWRDTIGFGQRTQIDYEHELSEKWFFRFGNSFTFSEESLGIDWTQRITLWQSIDFRTAISYNFGSTGHTRPKPYNEEFGFSVRYRKQIYSHWLFFEAEPQITWPIDDVEIPDSPREKVLRLIFRLEVQLGYD